MIYVVTDYKVLPFVKRGKRCSVCHSNKNVKYLATVDTGAGTYKCRFCEKCFKSSNIFIKA